jgi:hypothetical protein
MRNGAAIASSRLLGLNGGTAYGIDVPNDELGNARGT